MKTTITSGQMAGLTEPLLMQLIKSGRYDWVLSGIAVACFPVTEIPELRNEQLFYFGRLINTEEVITEMNKRDYRPATMAELLVYGAKNPEAQRSGPIVGLGSVAKIGNQLCVGVLDECLKKRGLGFENVDGIWLLGYSFLAVPK